MLKACETGKWLLLTGTTDASGVALLAAQIYTYCKFKSINFYDEPKLFSVPLRTYDLTRSSVDRRRRRL